MKILILLIFFSFIKFGSLENLNFNWTQVTKSQNGHEFFVNMKDIKENKNFIYFWQLINYKVIDEYGDLSAKIYIQGHCKTLKFKWVKVSYHKLFMAKDTVIAKLHQSPY